ncbi:MAG TPA: hypothetical protein VJH63_03035 [Candidatus Paceibacterota bacterium]
MDDEESPKEDLVACPECGGNMLESIDNGNELECEKCGFVMSIDDAKDLDSGVEE